MNIVNTWVFLAELFKLAKTASISDIKELKDNPNTDYKIRRIYDAVYVICEEANRDDTVC